MVQLFQQAAGSIAIIGFGEVGPVFAHALADAGHTVSIFDIKLHDAATRAAIVERAEQSGARVADDLASALRDAQLVFSAVTASQAEAVASAAAAHLKSGQVFVDLNSVSPAVKQRNSVAIQQNGADYVEAAVMAPVPPQGIRVPMLLGGRVAGKTAERLNALGMRCEAVAQEVGLASAIKLCRSIMIKGMEALCVQSMLAARQFDVDGRVLASLAASFPGVGWDTGYEAYLIGRVVEHGQRRSEEMREAALMLDGLGISSALAIAVADVQEQLAARGAPLVEALDSKGSLPEWRALLKPA
ncbi:NAD(P)-binding domain-containing protein [Paraburkholderia sp. MPAMCS5]|uniref:NAD(P)-dependent oxidoreductase n=1 Tax=Paraburkholderia sp. MPAMCS5 TaxID=3112563 RepID=UPI002E177D27|nr:NAD(P)-binding domain-containing protein [Paraburkholderia sp. MPAMCS5]